MSNPTQHFNNHITNNRGNNTVDDDATISTNNHSNTYTLPPKTITMGISDSGATGHFLQHAICNSISCAKYR